MKIVNEYYILIRPNTHDKNSLCETDCETVFLNEDYSFVNDVKCATRYTTKKCAYLVLHDYENRKCNSEPSGFVPIYVKEEITY